MSAARPTITKKPSRKQLATFVSWMSCRFREGQWWGKWHATANQQHPQSTCRHCVSLDFCCSPHWIQDLETFNPFLDWRMYIGKQLMRTIRSPMERDILTSRTLFEVWTWTPALRQPKPWGLFTTVSFGKTPPTPYRHSALCFSQVLLSI